MEAPKERGGIVSVCRRRKKREGAKRKEKSVELWGSGGATSVCALHTRKKKRERERDSGRHRKRSLLEHSDTRAFVSFASKLALLRV